MSSSLQIIPAIDLMGGKAIRLSRGQRESAKVYSDEPWTLVKRFVEDGAERIHVVDIDGAFGGAPEHRAVVRRIVAKSPVPIQVGGGLRDEASLDAAFASGVHFAVLGTVAIKDPAFAAAKCKQYPGRIVIAVDALDGRVAVEGWAEATDVSAVELAQKAQSWGASAVLYTDVSRDGLGKGVNVESTAELQAQLDIPVMASGGVGSLDDIRALARAEVRMVIVGRALYEKRFSLREAIAVAGGPC